MASSSAVVIGLTGGIGSGKTLVSNRLQELGAQIIDTDTIAHELTAPQGLAMPQILRRFGPQSVLTNGSMNRPYIRELVFKNPALRIELEKILHPLIRHAVKNALLEKTDTYYVLVVPLLIEKGGWDNLLNGILLVDCPPETQIERVALRNGWPIEQIQAIINTQASREQRLQKADFVIENMGPLPEIIQKIDFLHEKFRKIASK